MATNNKKEHLIKSKLDEITKRPTSASETAKKLTKMTEAQQKEEISKIVNKSIDETAKISKELIVAYQSDNKVLIENSKSANATCSKAVDDLSKVYENKDTDENKAKIVCDSIESVVKLNLDNNKLTVEKVSEDKKYTVKAVSETVTKVAGVVGATYIGGKIIDALKEFVIELINKSKKRKMQDIYVGTRQRNFR